VFLGWCSCRVGVRELLALNELSIEGLAEEILNRILVARSCNDPAKATVLRRELVSAL